MQYIPAILAKDEAEFRAKIDKIRPLGLMPQIDVMDGIFVKNTTWADPGIMRDILGDLPFEVHLMVSNPEHAVPVWVAAGAARVFYHAESTTKDELIFKACGDDAYKVGIAINPETPVSRITHFLDRLQHVLVMGVTPGFSGQAFQPIAADKIEAIKRMRPSIKIEVDGGVGIATAPLLARAGADILVAASAITDKDDPALGLAHLRAAAEATSEM